MRILSLVTAFFLAQAAAAHDGQPHDHAPLHGGVVAEAAGIDFELVAGPDLITLHARDHGQPVGTAGMSARLTLLDGGGKTEVALVPAADGRLQARGSFRIAGGTKAVALVTLPGGKTANVRFRID